MERSPQESPPPAATQSELLARRLLQELQVHQAELTQQNEDLQLMRIELEASLARRQALFEFAPIALLSVDGDGKVVELNRRAADLLGADAEPGMRLAALVTDDSRAALEHVLAGGHDALEIVCRTQADDGTARTADVQVRRPQAPVDELLVALAESTERHRAAQARLAQAGAETANRQKSAFLARMSHELRTPLNAVLGFTHLLSRDPSVRPGTITAAHVARIQTAGQHLLKLVDDVLDLARIEAGATQPRNEAFDAVDLLQEVATMLAPLAPRQPAKLRLPADVAGAWVSADRTRTRQVLINLIGNAIKYSPDGGEVRLDVVSKPGEVSVAIADDGPGLTPQQQAGLFMPFDRLGAERSAVSGVGLGLAIARELVDAMHGRLEVHSVKGQGSTFIVTLPSAPGSAVAEEPPTTSAPGSEQPLSVLYVEDNEVNAELMQGLLAELPRVQLTVVPDGERGLALAQDHPPDLVLLDMQLPDMDGLEFFARLRSNARTARVPCVVVSANAMTADVCAALDAGVHGYLTKPVDVAALHALIDRTRRGGPIDGPTNA